MYINKGKTMKEKLALQQQFDLKPSKWISWQTYEDKTYIIDERTGTLIKLEGSAVIFWNIMLDVHKINDILKKLDDIFYDVDSYVLHKDMHELVDDLVAQEIVEVKSYD